MAQNGGAAGDLFEPPVVGATFDGGIINIDGPTTGANGTIDVTLPLGTGGIVLIDGNEDDQFNLERGGDGVSGITPNSTVGDDGVAITTADIENRQGSTFSSINGEFGTPTSDAAPTVGALDEAGNLIVDGNGAQIQIQTFNDVGVIFHDEEADPQFILDGQGNLVANDQFNNALFAEDTENLERFGRVVATYDGFTNQPNGEDFFSVTGNFGDANATERLSLEVFVDVDRDGDIDFVDLDRDCLLYTSPSPRDS